MQTVREIFDRLTTWLAPMLPFTMEEAWLDRYPQSVSVHAEQFRPTPAAWRDDVLAEKWRKVRAVRRVVTGALELERADKRIGSSLEASPVVHISDKSLSDSLDGLDFAEICITSGISFSDVAAPEGAFTLADVKGVAVVPVRAEGENARGPGVIRRMWALIRNSRMCPPAMPRHCVS